MTSCQSSPKNEQERVDVDWPSVPYVEGAAVYPSHYDECGNDLVTVYNDMVTMPLSVWNQYLSYEEEVILPLYYFKMITVYFVDIEAAIDRNDIYKN